MSRRAFDPGELDQPAVNADRSIAELERYLARTAEGAPPGFADHAMTAIEQEPAHRRGLVAWLLTPFAPRGGMRRLAPAVLLAATLVIAIAGALFAGQLADLVRNVGSGTPTPTESVSPSQSVVSTPTATPKPTPSGSAEASEAGHHSPDASGSAEESESETPEASANVSGDESNTPRPSTT